MDKMSAYFLEIINKTITVGITDDLFSDTEKAQIIDDYSEWINKNNDEMATGYVICTCYMRFGRSVALSISFSLSLSLTFCGSSTNSHTMTIEEEREYEMKIETLHSIYVAFLPTLFFLAFMRFFRFFFFLSFFRCFC